MADNFLPADVARNVAAQIAAHAAAPPPNVNEAGFVPQPLGALRPPQAGVPYNARANQVEFPAGDGMEARRYNCANLMRPAVVTRMMQEAGRRIKLLAPVFIDTLAPNQMKENPDYIAVVAAMSVPMQVGARADLSLNICIQACSVGYAVADCGTPAEARRAVENGIKTRWAQMDRSITEMFPHPPWLENQDPIPENQLEYILEAISVLENQPRVTLEIFTTALLAYCKQGNVTNNVITKVTNAARDELGKNIQLNPNTIRDMWNSVGHWYDPEKARSFFHAWETAIGPNCLRFRLLCQQASWTGMTNFVNIKRARESYPNFDWAKCVRMFGGEFAAFHQAELAVGDNEYYGYRRDLGAAKSTLYPNLSYAAYALLLDVEGERSLRDFQGTNRNTPFAAQIDALIREYRTTRDQELDRPVNAQEQEVARLFLRRPDQHP